MDRLSQTDRVWVAVSSARLAERLSGFRDVSMVGEDWPEDDMTGGIRLRKKFEAFLKKLEKWLDLGLVVFFLRVSDGGIDGLEDGSDLLSFILNRACGE